MPPRPTRARASQHPDLDSHADAGPSQPPQGLDSHADTGPSQPPQGSSQFLPEASPASEGTPEHESHAQALKTARDQKAVAPPSPTHQAPPATLEPLQRDPIPTLAELMDDEMDICPDVPIDPVLKFQELLDAKQLEVHRVSSELAARLA
ncbi:hypothetical protein BGZ82_005079, partial [Podila clonocystis]